MERPLNNYKKGDVVILSIPFSNQTERKKRPAIIIATPPGNDVITIPITSTPQHNNHTTHITTKDFTQGNIHKKSYAKTKIIATIEKTLITKK